MLTVTNFNNKMIKLLQFIVKFFRMTKRVLGTWMMIISLMILVWILQTDMEVAMNILQVELRRLEIYLVQLCIIYRTLRIYNVFLYICNLFDSCNLNFIMFSHLFFLYAYPFEFKLAMRWAYGVASVT